IHPPANMLSDQPPFLTVQQASRLLHVSTWSVYQAIRSGELPVIRWGRRVVVQREDLATLVASKREQAIDTLPSRSRLSSARRGGAAGQGARAENQQGGRAKRTKRAHGEGGRARQKRDGTWDATLSLPDGSRKYFVAATQAEAVAKRDRTKALVARGLPIPDDK